MDEPPLHVILKLLLVFSLVLANGFFVGAEFALVTARRTRLKTLAELGSHGAKAALRLAEKPTIFISVTQFGVTVSSLVLGYLGEATIGNLLEKFLQSLNWNEFTTKVSAHAIALPISFAIITFLHIVIGEITPKTVALERSEKIATLSAIPIEIIYKIFLPFIWLLNHSGNFLLRLLGMKSSFEHTMAYTEDEIRQLIQTSYHQGHLIEEEQQMIHNVFDFTDTEVRAVMVPRPEIIAIEANTDHIELTKMLENSGYSRLPVYKDNLDNIVGIVYAKDILPYLVRNEKLELSKLLRKPLFVPDSAKLVEVLQQMKRAQNQLAIVVDEHGGVEGILSMEDLLEEIVGEIRDEYDEEEKLYHPESDGSVILEGALPIREANRKLNLKLPESEDYTTIAGFLMAKTGKLLSQGEVVEYQNTIFTIEKVERRRVSKVRVLPMNNSNPSIQIEQS